MGRNTWESIPVKFRPLPNRDNVVITRDKDYLAEGAIVTSDLEGLKRIFNLSSILFGPDEQFIIGGAEIYKQLLPIADKVYMTEVLGDIEGDTYLEGFNPEEWDLTNMSGVLEENGFSFIFKEYIKKVA